MSDDLTPGHGQPEMIAFLHRGVGETLRITRHDEERLILASFPTARIPGGEFVEAVREMYVPGPRDDADASAQMARLFAERVHEYVTAGWTHDETIDLAMARAPEPWERVVELDAPCPF